MRFLSFFLLVFYAVRIANSANVLKNSPVSLKIATITWNLAETTPLLSRCRFLKKFCDHDIVAIGVQECEDIRPRSAEGRRSKAWNVIQKYYLGSDFKRLTRLKLGGVQMSIFVSGVRTISVPCGLGNVAANKGAVCALLRIKGKTLAFTNAHLAAHENMIDRRNDDFHRITDSVIRKTPKKWTTIPSRLGPISKSSIKQSRKIKSYQKEEKINQIEDIFTKSVDVLKDLTGFHPVIRSRESWPFNGVFFMGDLNYRLSLNSNFKALKLKQRLNKAIVSINDAVPISNNTDIMTYLNKIRKYDQLGEQIKQKKAFAGFLESPICFMPSFKYGKHSPLFDSSAKQRCPAWTDRILYSSRCFKLENSSSLLDSDVVTPVSYDSIQDCLHGDHRPVYATFIVKL